MKLKIRPTVLMVVGVLGAMGIISLFLNHIEVATGCLGAMAGVATKLLEGDEKS